jgi:hypothetical protein
MDVRPALATPSDSPCPPRSWRARTRCSNDREPNALGGDRLIFGIASRKRKLRETRGGWWSRAGSNRRPPHCERGALPAELRPQPRAHGQFGRELRSTVSGRQWRGHSDRALCLHRAVMARAMAETNTSALAVSSFRVLAEPHWYNVDLNRKGSWGAQLRRPRSICALCR